MKNFILIGEKLGHSLSKELHELFFDFFGLNATYSLLEVKKEELHQVIAKLRSNEYQGMNVTIPYKKAVIPFLDGLSPAACAIGAVNTIVNENGKLIGHNTDYKGFEEILISNHIHVEGKKCFVLGNGGAAQSVIYSLLLRDAQVTLVTRSPQAVAKELMEKRVEVIDYQDVDSFKGELIVNTTPLGMTPHLEKIPLREDILASFNYGIDLIYNPVSTPFTRAFSKEINGKLMLIYQGIKAEELWYNKKMSLSKGHLDKLDKIFK